VRQFMKLFKSLLVAPATLGLLAPMTATANELNLKDVSGYSSSEEVQNISEFNPAEELAVTNSRVDGLEARLNNFEAGGFSETTTASFSVDAVLGAIDGSTSETTSLDYQFNIGLSTSFTGEDSLDIAIDSGNTTRSVMGAAMGFDTANELVVDGVSYTFPIGGATMVVGDATDISATFTGACVYSSFTDYTPDDCGTGNSLGAGGKGVAASIGYEFDNGFSLAAGISSPSTEIVGDKSDLYGLNAAYSSDTYGLAIGYVTDDGGSKNVDRTGEETTTWGFQGYYSFDLADLSVGYESQEKAGVDKTGYFVGLSFSEVGPGSVNVAAATKSLYKDTETEYMIYEASYSYPVNDGMTITPGVFITEGTTDETGVAVKASFSF
jgi:hypothetical protein